MIEFSLTNKNNFDIIIVQINQRSLGGLLLLDLSKSLNCLFLLTKLNVCDNI